MKLSLRTAIILAILFGLMIPAALSGYISLTHNVQQAKTSLYSDHQRLADILVLGLREPLWNMAPDAGRPLIDSLMRDERIVRITVTDSVRGPFLAVNRPDRRLGQLYLLTRPIDKQGNTIGSIDIEMDDGLATQVIHREQQQYVLTLLVQVIISLGLTLLLLRNRVLSPLSKLQQQAEMLASNKLDVRFDWSSRDELGQVGQSLEATRQSLGNLLNKLEQRTVQQEAELISRKHIEAALIASQDRCRRLLEATSVVPWDANPTEWRFTYVGPQAEKLLGFPLSDWYDEGFISNRVHPDDRHLIYELFTQHHLASHNFECRLLCKDGRQTWGFFSATNLVDAQGKRQLQGYVIDISTRKQVEAELERYRTHLEETLEQRTRQLSTSNHELDTISQSLSSDLRSPLRTIEGFSQVLLDDYSDTLDINARNYLQRIRVAINGMAGLIDDLLTLSKLSRAELHRQTVDLSALVRDIADELSILQPLQQVEAIVTPELLANADPRLLRIVLYNLLDNAWRFTSLTPQPIVRFGMAHVSGQEVFFISDNGIGFDMNQINKLFCPFQRLHTQAEFAGSGNGIGLAIVQRIINRHEGRVWAKSSIGEGATFYFTLPPH